MQRSRLGFLLTAVVLLVLGTLAGASVFDPEKSIRSQASCATAPSSSTIILDWAYGYSNLKEMKNAADRVVEGVVMGSSTSGCEIPVTHYAVKARLMIKGIISSSLIQVAQTGGMIGTSKQEVRDDPLMQTGDRVILFLHLDPQTGIYGILGGPQGRLVVRNQLVYSLNTLYPDRNIDIINWTINGLPHATVLDQLQ
jgi:hypothetical protein